MAARRTKRSDGRYAVTATINGRRVFFYGRTQTEAKAKAEEAKQRAAAGAPVRDARRSLSDWLAEWRETFLKASARAESTKGLYSGLLARHVEPVLGSMPLARISPSDVIRLLNELEERGMAASTRRSVYAGLRGALDDAVANGLLGVNPVTKVKRPRIERREAVSLAPADVAALLAASEGLRYAGILRLVLGTGLRRGEALGLRWEDVDLDRSELRVCGALVRVNGVLTLSQTKTASGRRTVALSPSMVALLKTQRAAQAAEKLRAANMWQSSGLVFTTEFGAPVDPRNVLRTVQIAAQKAGLTGVGVHSLRHTSATAALLAGVPLHVVSRNLGHSSVAITGDVYAHLTDDASRSAADAVAAALGL